MSSDGFFIDGLQTREEKRSRLLVRPASTRTTRRSSMPLMGAQRSASLVAKKVSIAERRKAVQNTRYTPYVSPCEPQRRVTQVAQSSSSRPLSAVQRMQLETAQKKQPRPQNITSSQDPFSMRRRVAALKPKKSGGWLDDMWKEKHGEEASASFVEPEEPEEPEKVQKKEEPEMEMGLRSENEYRRKVLGVADQEFDLDFGTEDLFGERRGKVQKERKPKEKTKRSKKVKRFALAAAGLVFVAAIGFYFWGDSIVQKITGGNAGLFDLFRSAVLSDGSAKFKTAADGRTNILMFGTSGYDMNGTIGEEVHDGAQLTDSIMVLSIDQESGDTAMISVQRDLLVGTCTNTGKINEVYFCANQNGDNEAGGAKALQDVVSQVLGVDLQYYVHVDWQALIAIVDALDGITVTLDEDIEDTWTNTFIRAGESTRLNGEQALGLARARHGTTGGDFTRANSQQKILMALKDRILERGLGLTELINIASVLGDNLRTDFSADEVAAGAKLATTTDLGAMRQISLMDTEQGGLFTTGIVNGISYVLPTSGSYNYSAIQQYVEGSLASATLSQSANILVLNGSGVTGIAAKERDQLVAAGFTVADIGDAPAGEYLDKIYLYNVGNKDEVKAKLEVYYNMSARNTDELPYGVNTDGIDFVVILGVGYSD